MTRILFISHIAPNVISSGGEHRTYQIYHELGATFGEGNVKIYDPRDPKPPSQIKKSIPWRYFRVPWRVQQAIRRIKHIQENPYQLFFETGFALNKFSYTNALKNYECEIDTFKPDLCIFQHAACLALLPINHRHKIPSVIAAQNLDSVDNALRIQSSYQVKSVINDLANEVYSLSSFDYRLFISKVETAFASGLGLTSEFYPYYPVGKVTDFFLDIRHARTQNPPEQGLFLMLGSASHQPIREGMEWVIDHVRRDGLPPNVHIICAGMSTEQLLANSQSVPGIELLGFVTEEKLRDLLISVQGILLPKTRGFGSATRIPEIVCAGIPLIASETLTYAIDTMPSVIPVPQQWLAWKTAMQDIADAGHDPAGQATWNTPKKSVLIEAVQRLL